MMYISNAGVGTLKKKKKKILVSHIFSVLIIKNCDVSSIKRLVFSNIDSFANKTFVK